MEVETVWAMIAVDAALNELRNRSGFDAAWDDCDLETQLEIQKACEEAARRALLNLRRPELETSPALCCHDVAVTEWCGECWQEGNVDAEKKIAARSALNTSPVACKSKKCGEFDMLECCRPAGHEGEHNYVVAR